MSYFRKRDGFSGEISYILPPDVLARTVKHPLVHPLYLTDVGYYPTARYHYRERPQGAREHILILCAEGKGWFKVRDRAREVSAREALLIPKDFPHTYRAAERDPWSIYWVHFVGESSGYFLAQLPGQQYSFPVAHKALARAIDLFQGIYSTLHKGYTLEQIIGVSLELGNLLGSLLFANEDFHPSLQTASNRRIDQSIEYMLEHVEKRLTLQELAAQARLSVPHYCCQFKIKTGYPPIEYFIRLKIQRASQYLDTTDLRIHTISEKLGYEDPYYFSRIFHKIMGISPQGYRRRHRVAPR